MAANELGGYSTESTTNSMVISIASCNDRYTGQNFANMPRTRSALAQSRSSVLRCSWT